MPDPAAKPKGPGLTLLDAGLAVAILGTIVGLVVLPATREAKIRRNEEIALEAVRAISTGQSLYWGTIARWGTLADLAAQGLDPAIVAGTTQGYSFKLHLEDSGQRAWLRADPVEPGVTGRRHFFVQSDPRPPSSVQPTLPRGKRSGYTFVMTAGNPADSNYFARSTPVTVRKTGGRRFFVDHSGVLRFWDAVRYRAGAPASSGDSPVE